MPLENNIKVHSSAEIKGKINVNITEIDPYNWESISAHDSEDATIWVKDEYLPERAITSGTVDVSAYAGVDLTGLDTSVPGTYPVYTTFKGLEASYEVVVKPMEMSISVSGMTQDYIYDDEGINLEFDGICHASYGKESLDKDVEPTEVIFDDPGEGVQNTATVEYTDSYYGISDSVNYYVNIHYAIDENSAVMNFREIEGFDEWTSSYTEHEIDFGYGIVTITASRQGEEQPINNEPVTKSGPFIIGTDELRRYIGGVSLSFDQWGGKQQTVHLDYSEDGGISWTDSGLQSSDFWLRGWLPEGVYANKIRFRFDNASNQVGIRYGVLYTHLEDEPIHRVKITGIGSVTEDDSVTWTANCIVPAESMNWEVIEGDGEVSLDPYTEEGQFYCDITGVAAGTVLIRATCEDGTYDEKEITVIGGGGGGTEYTESVTFSDIYSVDTVVDGTEIDIGSKGFIQLRCDKSGGGSQPKFFMNGGEIRIYGSNTMTVHLMDGANGYIKSIRYVVTSAQKAFTSDVPTLEWNGAQTTSVWSNTAGTDVTSVTITAESGSGNTRFKSVEVTYQIND